MTESEQFQKMKKNLLGLSWSMDDAPYHGVGKETILAIKYSVDKVLKDTGISLSDLSREAREEGWFSPDKN